MSEKLIDSNVVAKTTTNAELSLREQIEFEFKKITKFEDRKKELNGLLEYLQKIGFIIDSKLIDQLLYINNKLMLFAVNIHFDSTVIELTIALQTNIIDKNTKKEENYACLAHKAFKPFLAEHTIYKIFRSDDDDYECNCNDFFLVFDKYPHFMIRIAQYICDVCTKKP